MKTDCYFYETVQDMGGSFEICNYPSKFEDKCYAKCDKCRRYISNKMADMLIRLHIDEQICKEDYPELFNMTQF